MKQKSFLSWIFESQETDDSLCEANLNHMIEFGTAELDSLAMQHEDDDDDEVAKQYFNINVANDIYLFLKDNVECPEFFSFIIKELYSSKDELDGLFASNADEKNKMTTSANKKFINFICIDGSKRNQLINSIVQIFKTKIRLGQNYPIANVSIKHHEIKFTPNAKFVKDYKLRTVIIHIVQPTSDRAINKISSDITEYLPTIALKLLEVRPAKVKQFLKIEDPKSLVDFIKKIKEDIKDIASSDDILSLINGIENNIKRPKIIEKVKNGMTMARFAADYVEGKDVSDAHITNEKAKVDSADFRVKINGKDFGFSVKDDKINGKGHSLRDFSLLKQVETNPEYKKIFNCMSFEKYLKAAKLNENDEVNTKEYFNWIGNSCTNKLQKAIMQNKEVYASIFSYAFNLDNPDTLILSHSGVYTNNGESKDHASYKLIKCRNLLADNDPDLTVDIQNTNAIQRYTFKYKGKPLLKYIIQIGAGKYNTVLESKIKEALNTDNFYIPVVLKYKDLDVVK